MRFHDVRTEPAAGSASSTALGSLQKPAQDAAPRVHAAGATVGAQSPLELLLDHAKVPRVHVVALLREGATADVLRGSSAEAINSLARRAGLPMGHRMRLRNTQW
jgi:hypothetical protein